MLLLTMLSCTLAAADELGGGPWDDGTLEVRLPGGGDVIGRAWVDFRPKAADDPLTPENEARDARIVEHVLIVRNPGECEELASYPGVSPAFYAGEPGPIELHMVRTGAQQEPEHVFRDNALAELTSVCTAGINGLVVDHHVGKGWVYNTENGFSVPPRPFTFRMHRDPYEGWVGGDGPLDPLDPTTPSTGPESAITARVGPANCHSPGPLSGHISVQSEHAWTAAPSGANHQFVDGKTWLVERHQQVEPLNDVFDDYHFDDAGGDGRRDNPPLNVTVWNGPLCP